MKEQGRIRGRRHSMQEIGRQNREPGTERRPGTSPHVSNSQHKLNCQGRPCQTIKIQETCLLTPRRSLSGSGTGKEWAKGYKNVSKTSGRNLTHRTGGESGDALERR